MGRGLRSFALQGGQAGDGMIAVWQVDWKAVQMNGFFVVWGMVFKGQGVVNLSGESGKWMGK